MGQLATNLANWRSEYGRLCVLIAQALTRGHNKAAVIEAAQGLGDQCVPALIGLRRQRDRANQAYFAAKKTGATPNMVIAIARDTRQVVSDEFMFDLPLLKGATT